ncbi:MAG: hypothetical protein ABI969_18940 [bacterium]
MESVIARPLNEFETGKMSQRQLVQTLATGEASPAAPATAAGEAVDRGGAAARPPFTGVINHISWGIEPWDTKTARSELTKRGLNPRVDTGTRGDIATSTFKSLHGRDPDGLDLQVGNQTREKHEL